MCESCGSVKRRTGSPHDREAVRTGAHREDSQSWNLCNHEVVPLTSWPAKVIERRLGSMCRHLRVTSNARIIYWSGDGASRAACPPVGDSIAWREGWSRDSEISGATRLLSRAWAHRIHGTRLMLVGSSLDESVMATARRILNGKGHSKVPMCPALPVDC